MMLVGNFRDMLLLSSNILHSEYDDLAR